MFKFLLFLTLSLATTSAFGAALDRRHRQSLRRGTANTCSTQEGAGTCQTASQCETNETWSFVYLLIQKSGDGISYGAQGLCPYDPQDVQVSGLLFVSHHLLTMVNSAALRSLVASPKARDSAVAQQMDARVLS